MNDEELVAAGVSSDLVRYSCGIENKDDLISDLKSALESI
jgi:O-acetylhomoserine (thiol)-lyase